MHARALSRVALSAVAATLGAVLVAVPASAATTAMSATTGATGTAGSATTGARPGELTVSLALGSAPGARAAVADFARAHGLRVVGATSRSVTLAGPAAAVRAAFATGTAAGTGATGGARSHAAGDPAGPTVPAALRGAVRSATGLSDAPVARHYGTRRAADPRALPRGVYNGGSLHQLYGPSTTAGTGYGLTIGIVSFSGWILDDATHYAQSAGIPLAPGQISSVSVDGARTDAVDGSGGDFEAAMDVETLLAVAPRARIVVYVADNDLTGAVDLFNKMADDAAAGKIQIAVSSWGNCESEWESEQRGVLGPTGALTTAVSRIVSSGATMFAATGDAGAWDCSSIDQPDGTLAVDFPASSPSVIAVGGTTVVSTSPPQEKAWGVASSGNPATTYQGDGTGGGVSSYYSTPAWQAGVNGHRTVPDIAAMADPDPGVAVYSDGAWYGGGGTSVSAPIEAGLLASAMSAAQKTAGLGDIHAQLYAAASTAYRDITTGTNGGYNAGPGYDLVTGLGAPLWDTLATTLGLTPTAPSSGTSSRLAGTDRIATAVAVSQNAFPDDGSAGAVVLSRSDAYADALAGTPLAAAKQAPLLLTPSTQLANPVAQEMQRVLPAGGTVYLLGSTAALSAGVEQAVQALGYHTVRLGGANRFATATLIADQLSGRTTVMLVTGLGYADALSAGAAAAGDNGVLLLTNGTKQAADTATWLSHHSGLTLYAVGGAAATAVPSATRIVGTDRYDTAVRVGRTFFPSATVVGLTTGLNFPDALAAGAVLGAEGAPLLMTAPTALPGVVADNLASRRAAVTGITVFGSPSAVADATLAQAQQSIGWARASS